MAFYNEELLIGESRFEIQVGQNSVLLIDMDPNHVSISKIQNDLERLNLVYANDTRIPEDLNKHKSVFVFLGTHYSNHEITYSEGLKLLEYLNEGGNLYLEGRVTWSQQPSPVHHAFEVDITGSQFFIIDTVYTNQNDTILQQSLFFNHPEPFGNYYFLPQNGAFSLLNFTKNDSACVVANRKDTYKTVASIIEYGSLEGIDTSYTADDYLFFITDFFGLYENTIGINEFYEASKENIFLNVFPNPFTDNINIQFKSIGTGVGIMEVFNGYGQIIHSKKILPKMETDRDYKLEWDGRDFNGNKVNSGIYYIKVSSGNEYSIAKIIRL